jgi:hypothetical protein
MVEARIHFRLDFISLSYMYKVFKPLPMQWMDIWRMGGLPKIHFVFILAQVMGVVSTATITRDQSHGRVDAAVIEAIGLGEVHLVVTLLLLLL